MDSRKNFKGSNNHSELLVILLCNNSYHQIHRPRSFEEIVQILLRGMPGSKTD